MPNYLPDGTCAKSNPHKGKNKMALFHNPYMLTLNNPSRKKRRRRSSAKRRANRIKTKHGETTMKKITRHNPSRKIRRRRSTARRISSVAKSTIKDIAMPVAGFYAANFISGFIKEKFFPISAAPAPTQGIGAILSVNEIGSKAAGLFAIYMLEKHVTKTHGMFEGAAIGTAVNLISKATEGTGIAKYTRIGESDPMLEEEEVINGEELDGAAEVIGEVIGEDFAPMGEVIGEDDEDDGIGEAFSPVGG